MDPAGDATVLVNGPYSEGDAGSEGSVNASKTGASEMGDGASSTGEPGAEIGVDELPADVTSRPSGWLVEATGLVGGDSSSSTRFGTPSESPGEKRQIFMCLQALDL